MLKIGLTGSIGCGKSSVSKILVENGFYIIDADKIARNIFELPDIVGKIKQNFETVIIDGKIDRKKLGSIVFSNSEKLDILNNITHDKIRKIIFEEIKSLEELNCNHIDKVLTEEKRCYKGIVVDAPLLFEVGLDSGLDCTVAVVCDVDLEIKRVMERDGISREEVLRRIDSQMGQDEKAGRADFVIDNSGSYEELRYSVLNLIERLDSYR